jgi:Na+/H+-dicarboxylate symporter
VTTAPRLRFPSFGAQVLIGLALGVALGFWARSLGEGSALAEALQTVGSIFVQLLRALVPPLVFAAIVASIAALKDLKNAARLVAQTLLWFAATALIAVVIGIALGLLLEPGLRTGVDASAAAAPSTTGTWLDFLKGARAGQFSRPVGLNEARRRCRHHRAVL